MLRWPKPFTRYLTRPQIKLVLRIYWMDKLTRRKAGYVRSSFGLRARLAREFKVPEWLIKEITKAKGRTARARFLDINLEKEKSLARRRIKNRRQRYAQTGSEQDSGGARRL